MIRLSAPRHAALAVSALLALAFGLAGCTKKIASVDPGYISPEGTPSPKARLIVTPDIPAPYLIYVDEKNDGFTPDDTPDPANPYLTYASGPGAIIGTIFDSTLANAYQVLRREANGGYRIAQDFSQQPAHKWLDTQWEAYSFADPAPSAFQPPTYLGRGFLSGQITAQSPLTNAALTSSGGIDDLTFDYQGTYNVADFTHGILTYNPPDSADIHVGWTEVTGAAGYWIAIYATKGTPSDFLYSTLPAPIPLRKSLDYLLVYVSAPGTSYLAYPSQPPVPGAPEAPADLILTSHPILKKAYYFLRITAISPSGEILAYTAGDNLVVLPGAPRLVGTVNKNTWNLTLQGAIQLRAGPQVATAPQDRAESFQVLPARPGSMLMRGRGLTP